MKPKLVMVVDDEALIAQWIEETLRAAGFEVVVAASAEAALEHVETALDAAAHVTDIRLPGMSGWELARHVRRRFPSVAVIYISGDSAAHWPSEGVPNSAMIAKPFVASELLAVLASLLEPPADYGEQMCGTTG